MKKKLPDNEVLKLFPEAEREEVLRIWELAKKKFNPEVLDATELKAEWQRLQLRLREEGPAEGKRTLASDRIAENNQTSTNKLSSSDENNGINKLKNLTKVADQSSKEAQTADSGQSPRVNHVPGMKRSLHLKRHSGIGRSFRMRRLYPVMAAVAAVLIAGFAGWFYYVPVTIEAPRGSFVSYEWSDGTRVELNSGSQISYYRSLQNGHRSITLLGEAYFDVPTSERPFVVSTNNARVEVLGTRFNVRSWGFNSTAETILTLIEGEVLLSSFLNPEKSILLQPGQWSRVDQQAEAPYEPEEVDTNRALAWRDQGFYFASAPMSDVADELVRRFNYEIELENEKLADRNLTLYLSSPKDLESIITSICHLTGCRYDWSDDKVVLY